MAISPLVLLFPFLAYALFRRFLPERWSLALIFFFVAIPVGTLFGTSFVQYEQWAARGFADPAAYILFVAGTVLIVPAQSDERRKFCRAFFGALLLALGIFMKPIVAPAAAVLLGGAGVAALYLRQWARLAGLCIGFLPVFSMALHNWVYGHVFVLFSANAEHAAVLVMPPSAYAAAAHELATLALNGEHLRRLLLQLAQWLSGPAESYATIPLNAAGVADSRLRRCPRTPVRSMAAPDRGRGARAAHCRPVLYGRDRSLSLPHLVPHHAGGRGLVSPGRS